MLTIRLQRTGRSGYAMFRMVVQDSRQTPTSGKVVVSLGSYDPHAKSLNIDKEKTSFYLEHGAQPSPRVVRLLRENKVALPSWVSANESKQGKLRNADKLRRNRPAEVPSEAPAKEEAAASEPAAEAASAVEEPTTEASAEAEAAAETPESTDTEV
jgi:small subunit ribosomal protein S16